jgi:putative oxygen-independent coproporphyrinogen III oxidase
MAVSEISNTSSMGVYIHWPFCTTKCPYCDFNSHVKDTIEHARWREALLTELSYFADNTKGRTVTSVFFGGGTPSLMAPETVASLIRAIKNHWITPEDMEVTLEANPSTAETRRFGAFRDAGINRLSLGVQSLRDENLKYLGRGHSAADAEAAINLAARTFPRFSFDLMYGLPGQTRSHWQKELRGAISLVSDHLSVYQLTIEPGTLFFRDKVPAAPEKIGMELYQDTQKILENSGFVAYEISNHARARQHCRHNMNIWRGGDYVGIGPGAHGRLTGASGTDAIYQIYKPERWLHKVESDGHATVKRSATSKQERAEEILMTGLRLSDGISSEKLVELEAVINKSKLKRMINGGFIEMDTEGLRATSSGRLCLNEVLFQLLGNS